MPVSSSSPRPTRTAASTAAASSPRQTSYSSVSRLKSGASCTRGTLRVRVCAARAHHVRFAHGELTNYANIARDCGVDAKTVKEYYQILVDTLLGSFVPPWKKRQQRQVIGKAAKFYLFDVGLAGALTRRQIVEERGEQFGRALEHFVLMELLAHRSYRDLDYGIHFWRTKSGLEVDFVLGDGEVAVEVKGTSRVDPSDLRSLRAFAEDNRPRRAIMVCNERAPRIHEGIEMLPWREFLARLWGGAILR